MYIHIGNRKIVSDRNIIGIFNARTIQMSEENRRYFEEIEDHKTVIIYRNDYLEPSSISPATLLGRTEIRDNVVWRREND